MAHEIHKVIVFGASGYLGLNLCDFLLRKGYSVTGVDLKTCEETFSKKFTFLQADVTNRHFFQQFENDYDAAFFLTGLSGTAKSFDHYEDFLKVNELSLLHFLDSLKKSPKKPRIIFPSSRLVYHGESGVLAEDAVKESKTIYSVNKIACEAYLEAYHKAFDIDYRVLRICVPYGNLPGRSYSYGTIGFFLKQAQQGEITLYGEGSLRRTFTHVEDLSRQLCALAETTEESTSVYNSCGEDYSLKEVAQMVAGKYHAGIRFCEFPEFDLKLESGDTVFNSRKLETILQHPVSHTLQNWLLEI